MGVGPSDPLAKDGDLGSNPSIVSYSDDESFLSTSMLNKATEKGVKGLFSEDANAQGDSNPNPLSKVLFEQVSWDGLVSNGDVAQVKVPKAVDGVADTKVMNKTGFENQKAPPFDRGYSSGLAIGSCSYSYLMVSTVGNMSQVSPLSLVSYPPSELGLLESEAGVIPSNLLFSFPCNVGGGDGRLVLRVSITLWSFYNPFLI